jgi:hypothetical protein
MSSVFDDSKPRREEKGVIIRGIKVIKVREPGPLYIRGY